MTTTRNPLTRSGSFVWIDIPAIERFACVIGLS
jgi:hypothetical protein